MNNIVYELTPANVQDDKCDKKDLQGYLELEVCLINLIITNTCIQFNLNSGKLPENQIISEKKADANDTPFYNVIINNNKNISKDILSSIWAANKVKEEKGNLNQINLLESVQVEIVWCGERKEDAANIYISCKTDQQIQHTEQIKLKTKRKYFNNPHIKRHDHDQIVSKHQQAIRKHLLLPANNKLRYRICTNSALLLEYLRSCKPIKIIVTGGSDSCSKIIKPLGQAQFSLPLVFLKKFIHNIVKGHHFKIKTKAYTLYKQNKEAVERIIVKSREIQLSLKMLFAPAAAVSATAVAVTQHPNVKMRDKRLLLNNHYQHHHHRLSGKSNKVPEDIQGDIPIRLTSHTKSEEIVEAMKKLDAKLVAYLAGETKLSSKLTNCEEENKVNLSLENNTSNNLENMSPVAKFNIFKTIAGIQLEMEALTLQPDGTKCLDVLQNEIEPVFTVECQLSNELIKLVPRHDMFHIMQFESEKYQSLTQCIRFSQKAERSVKLDLNADWSDENANETVHDFGRIHFTVWWREPGTCLNEMLGMGTLELNDLYNASLLEQCKRVEIQRRDKHLAHLYLKVTLQRDALKSTYKNMKNREIFLPKQILMDNDSEKTSTTDKNKNNSTTVGQKQAASQCGMQSDTAANSNSGASGTDKASAKNKNVKFETTNFDDETSKIRLLKGFISANETRNLKTSLQSQTILVCRRFWLDEPAAAKGDGTCKFNYQEQFSVINDEKFLQRVDKQYLHLELWQHMSSDDGNGNPKQNAHPVGVVSMPLHQFFIAYRDADITNHLCKGKLPVISIDAWAPIISCQTSLQVGEIKCLLAVGSDEQIKNLKETRGLTMATISSDLAEDRDFISKLQTLQIPTTSNVHVSGKQSNTNISSTKIKNTSELMDMLQKVLKSPSIKAPDSQSAKDGAVSLATASEPKYSTETGSRTSKPSNVKLFKFSLEIEKAIGLPLNPALKAKKGYSKRNASKRFPPNEAPTCYVTFQAEEGQYPTHKSHEGMVFATNIVEKSTQPQWQQRFRLAVSTDYLNVPQKLFILKVLKKSSLDMAEGRNQPAPMEDAIIGLTAIDLSAFTRGLHIAGTFNIVDFNGRINGHLMLRCQPLDDILPTACDGPTTASVLASCSTASSLVDSVIDQFEHTLDLSHLNLGQAIKRKFNELEGISQRLRCRLGDVTGSELPTAFDFQTLNAWQPIEIEASDDKYFDEFEHDLNTSPIDEEMEFGEENIYNYKCQGKSETDNNEKNE